MASMELFCYIVGPSNLRLKYSSFGLCFQNPIYRKNALSSISARSPAKPPLLSSSLVCSAANKPSSSSEISSDARIRSEVLSSFRSLRMFFCLAFIASSALGGLIATTQENTAKNAQLARLLREESLSNLKLRVNENMIIPVSSLRGIASLVICSGPTSFILESFKLSEPFTERLLERGVLVVTFATDGNSPSLDLMRAKT
ncbi:hypothetical protein F3Y22_tig00002919pilonHSYRG00244 [Hibiscus syriacus]|uniref:Uncharacterized protein n=1 Tax=Hibiscus syriacus TaxID=106335 RepID=A0A6A3CTS2_HIBSY|nr:hypothetical protein F3Y22_tig00002919pilonHSYRG00244 [Hibiscus syriacus]